MSLTFQMQLYQQVGDSTFTCVANLQPNFLPLESPLVMLSSNQAKAYAKLAIILMKVKSEGSI